MQLIGAVLAVAALASTQPAATASSGPSRVGRIDCSAPGVVQVETPVVELRKSMRGLSGWGSAVFRVTAGYRANILSSRTIDGEPAWSAGFHRTPGTYRTTLPIRAGRWLVGCFFASHHSPLVLADHSNAEYAEVRIVR